MLSQLAMVPWQTLASNIPDVALLGALVDSREVYSLFVS